MNTTTRTVTEIVANEVVQACAKSMGMEPQIFVTALRRRFADVAQLFGYTSILEVCHLIQKHRIDPFSGHLYLQVTGQPGRQVLRPVLGVDGWLAVINQHEQFQGVSFTYSPESMPNPLQDQGGSQPSSVPVWMEATIVRGDRQVPFTVREYFMEVYQPTDAWFRMGSRQLRHKTLIQCARVAFGMSGLFDEDDISRMNAASPMAAVEGEDVADPDVAVQSRPRRETVLVEAESETNEADVQAPAEDDAAEDEGLGDELAQAFGGADTSESPDASTGKTEEAEDTDPDVASATEGEGTEETESEDGGTEDLDSTEVKEEGSEPAPQSSEETASEAPATEEASEVDQESAEAEAAQESIKGDGPDASQLNTEERQAADKIVDTMLDRIPRIVETLSFEDAVTKCREWVLTNGKKRFSTEAFDYLVQSFDMRIKEYAAAKAA